MSALMYYTYMANPNSIIGAITDEFEQVGKQVVSEVVKIPKDITGTALESLGLSSGKKKQNQKMQTNTTEPKTQEEANKIQQDEQTKKIIARKALEEIAGIKPKQKEQTVWEKIQEEEQQKKEAKKQKQAQAAQALKPAKAKRARGDLYGMKAKKTGMENKNVRQD
jgi:hypothetical protein